MQPGQLAVLNTGKGDMKLSFDKANEAERIRASRIVKDMIRRGYALLIEVDDGNGGKRTTRALDFDENTCEYIIADFDPGSVTYVEEPRYAGATSDDVPHAAPGTEPEIKMKANISGGSYRHEPIPRAPLPPLANTGPQRRGRKARVPAEGTTGVAVAPTAGG